MWGVIGDEVTDPVTRPTPYYHTVLPLYYHFAYYHPVNQYTPKSLRVHFKLNNGGYAITDG